jgi:hypothetical protein
LSREDVRANAPGLFPAAKRGYSRFFLPGGGNGLQVFSLFYKFLNFNGFLYFLFSFSLMKKKQKIKNPTWLGCLNRNNEG